MSRHSPRSARVRWRPASPRASSVDRSRLWTSAPPGDRPDLDARSPHAATARARAAACSSSRSATSSASGSKPGASSTSTNCSCERRAGRGIDRPVDRDHAAEGALRVAGERRGVGGAGVGATAQPHGLLCLTITQAGSSNSSTSSRAAARSSRLLYESSLPCSWRTPPSRWTARRRGVVGAPLMRVLAVTQLGHQLVGVEPRRAPSNRSRRPSSSRSPRRSGRSRERLGRQALARRERQQAAAALELVGDGRVVARGRRATAANCAFFAAARIIVGPPMSMFSMISPTLASPRATVCSNG